MIFTSFLPIEYAGHPTADIFHNFKMYVDQASKDLILRDYMIEGSDRPELVSWKLYNDSQYYWVLLMLNAIYDPYHGWIKSQEAVHQSSEYRYKETGGVYHTAYHINDRGKRYYNLYEDDRFPGHWYDKSDHAKEFLQYKGTLVPVSIIEDELNKNEQKRIIKIIAPGDINSFISSLRRIIGSIK
ncbi:MAG: hypothetical protein [Caudoviricetes sp.]|nr:MAG: hypothetical protein [Caudoviricetes sp.]